jgi:hypothetical protein
MLGRKRLRVRELEDKLEAMRPLPELARRRAAMTRERMRLADLGLQAERGTLDASLQARREHGAAAAAAIDADLDRVLAWASLEREQGRLAAAIGGETGGARR